MENSTSKDLIKTYLETGNFSPVEISLDEEECLKWVKLKKEPYKFVPEIFAGDWDLSNLHPRPGKLRVLAVVTAPDKVTRLISRQKNHLYAFPWL